MKKLGFLVLVTLTAVMARSQPAEADPPIYYCDLTGAGYSVPSADSYQYCMDRCYVLDTQNDPTYGECWTTPPPPPGPPGTPNLPPSEPDTQT
jgi:hypothetical protein